MYKESYFDGGLFSYIGHVILATLTVLLCSFLEIGSSGGS